jgi:hypothetical protein
LKLAVRIRRIAAAIRAHPSGKSFPFAAANASFSSGRHTANAAGCPRTVAICSRLWFASTTNARPRLTNCSRGIGTASGTDRYASVNTACAISISRDKCRQSTRLTSSPGILTASAFRRRSSGSSRRRPAESNKGVS